VIGQSVRGESARKRKLSRNRKEGKKAMKRVGRVEIPQGKTFLSVWKVGQSSEETSGTGPPGLSTIPWIDPKQARRRRH